MAVSRIAGAVLAGALLALPAAAGAADVQVKVRDFEYLPSYVRVDPGDTVTWKVLEGQSHTMTARRGAPAPFDSDVTDPGQTFSFTFATRGRYDYFCTIHPFLGQEGVIQVGRDAVKPVLRAVKARRGRAGVRLSFRLSEEARVKAVFRRSGRIVKTVRTRLLGDGAGSLLYRPRSLTAGSYRVTLTATDREGNASGPRAASFRVP